MKTYIDAKWRIVLMENDVITTSTIGKGENMADGYADAPRRRSIWD
jgi:hypothetical protein